MPYRPSPPMSDPTPVTMSVSAPRTAAPQSAAAQRWERYEQEKAALWWSAKSAVDYEQAVRQLAERMGI